MYSIWYAILYSLFIIPYDISNANLYLVSSKYSGNNKREIIDASYLDNIDV